jgi:hypothetical protein
MSQHRKTYQDRDGIRRTLVWEDEKPDEVSVYAEQRIDEIMTGIARNRELMNRHGPNKLAASIPAVHADRVLSMDPDELDHWLNDSANEQYRVWKGRV